MTLIKIITATAADLPWLRILQIRLTS